MTTTNTSSTAVNDNLNTFLDYNDLSEGQEKWLSLLPLLPSLLSILGSSAILYMVLSQQSDRSRRTSFSTRSMVDRSSFSSSSSKHQQHQQRQRPPLNPYKRILIAMSLCDIFVSLAYPFWPFAVPDSYDTEHPRHVRAWAAGNHTTCSTMGFMTQLSVCCILYHGMLSYYFLWTARYGKSNDHIAKHYERYLHIVALAFPILTASLGMYMNMFHETQIGIGCWVSDFPENCEIEDPSACLGTLVGWIYGGLPILGSLFSIIVNNFLIYSHVHTTISTTASSLSGPSDAQTRRVQAVAVQASLYVGSFMATYSWTIILRILESMSASTESSVYPLLILQAIFLPMNGLFNALVYVRPKYIKVRRDFAKETKLWALRRSVFGDSVEQQHFDDILDDGSSALYSQQQYNSAPLTSYLQSRQQQAEPIDSRRAPHENRYDFTSREDETENTAGISDLGMSPLWKQPKFVPPFSGSS